MQFLQKNPLDIDVDETGRVQWYVTTLSNYYN